VGELVVHIGSKLVGGCCSWMIIEKLMDKLVVKLIIVNYLGTSQFSKLIMNKQRTSLFQRFDLLKNISVILCGSHGL